MWGIACRGACRDMACHVRRETQRAGDEYPLIRCTADMASHVPTSPFASHRQCRPNTRLAKVIRRWRQCFRSQAKSMRTTPESLEELPISSSDLCISLKEISIFLREIGISSGDLPKWTREIGISSEELTKPMPDSCSFPYRLLSRRFLEPARLHHLPTQIR